MNGSAERIADDYVYRHLVLNDEGFDHFDVYLSELADLPESDSLEWQALGRCRETDPEGFFPEKGSREMSLLAKRICASCVVRPECLRYALDHNENDGVWGGLSKSERAALKKRLV